MNRMPDARRPTTYANYRDMLKSIDEDGEKLTEWEIEFVSDLIDSGYDNFTERQQELIQRIYDQRVS